MVNDISGSVTGDGSGSEAATSTVQEIQVRGGEAIDDASAIVAEASSHCGTTRGEKNGGGLHAPSR